MSNTNDMNRYVTREELKDALVAALTVAGEQTPRPDESRPFLVLRYKGFLTADQIDGIRRRFLQDSGANVVVLDDKWTVEVAK